MCNNCSIRVIVVLFKLHGFVQYFQNFILEEAGKISLSAIRIIKSVCHVSYAELSEKIEQIEQ